MAGLGHPQDTATPGGAYLQGQLVTDSGLAAHHVYIGEAGRLPGARTTYCSLLLRPEMDFSLPLERATTGVGGENVYQGFGGPVHGQFTTLPTRSRRGAWIDAVAGGSPYGIHHDRSSGRM